jgi:hypothetical protein
MTFNKGRFITFAADSLTKHGIIGNKVTGEQGIVTISLLTAIAEALNDQLVEKNSK